MSVASASTQAPPIRSVQYGGGGSGAADSVNLFRGDVDYELPLVTMPGRNGLDVQIAAFYQGNVTEQAQRWNLDAPTGVLGLGWSLPTERIVLTPSRSGAVASRSYALQSGGSINPLVADDREWLRFELDAGTTVTVDALRAGFAARGMRLAGTATVQAVEDGAWHVVDAEHARCFLVRADGEGGRLGVYAGGQSYQLQSYSFWQIRYYADTESWEITKDDGLTYVYGGNQPTFESRNPLAWGVQWGTWIGASAITHDADGRRVQQRYVKAWNLVEIRSKWHDAVTLSYDAVEQRVGEDGLAYTKATYLDSITDVYGRSVRFTYGDKEYHDPFTNPSGPREYQDPYEANPSGDPSPYQSAYETRYLDSLDVRATDDSQLFSVHFEYQVANVFQPGDDGTALYGDTFKRYLTAVHQRTEAGGALPALEFEYFLDVTEDGVPLGALRRLTSPLGAVTTFDYEKKELPLCDRSVSIDCPAPWRGKAKPRVWFGPDYAVVVWYNAEDRQLLVEMRTWLGDWRRWAPSDGPLPTELDLESLQVITASDYAALAYPSARAGDGTRVHLFRRSARQLGVWLEHETITIPSKRVDVTGGDGFVLAADWEHQQLYRWTWEWAERAWTGGQLPADPSLCAGSSGERRYFVAAGADWYLVLCVNRTTKQQRATVFYRDELDGWHTGGSVDLTFGIVFVGETPLTAWAVGAGLAAFSHVTDNGPGRFSYGVCILTWTPDYATLTATSFEFDQPKVDGEMRIGYAPLLAADTLLGVGPHLLRFDGVAWRTNEQLEPTIPYTRENTFYFAFGDDLALGSELTPYEAQAALDAFDPAASGTAGWSPGRVDFAIEPPVRATKRRFYPTVAAGGFFSLDRSVYVKTPLVHWPAIVDAPVHTFDPMTDTTTVVNQGPAYLSYLVLDDDNQAVRTDIVIFENGRAVRVESIDEQYYTTTRDGRPVFVPGKSPAGPDAFFTFPLGTTIDRAASITLYRCVGGSVRAPIPTWVVTSVSVDDGFDTRWTTYEYDEVSAACDPSGRVAKFYRALASPGPDRENGYTQCSYFNGLAGGEDGAVESLLDGMLVDRRTYDADGIEVAASSVTYDVYDSVVPLDARARGGAATEPVPLAGAFVALVASAAVQDGVRTDTTQEIELTGGNPRRVHTDTFNAFGAHERLTTTSTYGYEAYPELHSWSLVNAIVQEKATVTADGADPVVTSVSATTWRSWPVELPDGSTIEVPAQHQTWALAAPAADPDFPFHGTPGEEWRRLDAIVDRDDVGLVVETEDVEGRPSSTVYDRGREHVVAEFANASLDAGDAAYTGFESYEAPSGWTLPPSSSVVGDDAHTGVRSVAVAAGGEGPHRTFAPTSGTRSFLFTAWVKATASQPEGSGWTIVVRVDGEPRSTVTLPFGPAGDAWQFRLCRLDVDGAEDATVEVAVSCRNSSGGTVLVDDLAFRPFLSGLAVTVYDAATGLPLSQLDGSDGTTGWLYNRWRAPVAAVGRRGAPTSLAIGYLSRQHRAAFDRTDPNQAIAMTARSGGSSCTFRDGDEWRRTWEPTPATDWSVRDHELRHTGGAEGTLRSTGPDRDAGFYADVRVPDAPAHHLGVRVGSRFVISWSPATRTWEARRDGVTLPTLPQPTLTVPQGEWLVVTAGRVLLFYADGGLVLRHVDADEVTGAVELFATDPIGIATLAVLDAPQLSVEMRDGSGASRQVQALGDSTCVVTGGVYDGLGRAAVAAKPVAFPLEGEPFLAYRPNLVTAFDWRTGVLSGEVADYYSGQDGRSDDEGYPYSRTRFERSPLGRAVEQGLPGRELAIDETVPIAERHTTRVAYAANGEDDFPALGLPTGEYALTTTTDPSGVVTKSLSTKLGDDIAAATYLPDGTAVTSATRTVLHASGATTEALPPNAFTPDGSISACWQATSQTDLLGDAIGGDDPDGGRGETVYDRAGRPRFTVDARGLVEGFVVYAKYDVLGRAVEAGLLEVPWDRAALQALADDRSYPTASDGAIVRHRNEFDGDGRSAELLGRLWRATTFDDRGTEVTEQEYGYSPAGGVRSVALRVPSFGPDSFVTTYEYDNLGDVASVTAQSTTTYAYDRLGNVGSISPGEAAPTSYTHDANGAPWRQTTAGSLVRDFRYTPAGRLASHSWAGLFSEAFSYTPDGRTASVDTVTPATSYRYRFRYDAAGRLVEADRGGNAPGGFMIDGLDGNGNLLSGTRDSKPFAYRYRECTNRVLGATTSEDDFDYDVVGNIVRSASRRLSAIEYDRFHGLTARLVSDEFETTLTYDADGARVLRDRAGERTLSVPGLDGWPLLSVDGGGLTTQVVRAGTALLAAVVGGRVLYVVSDRLGSTRLVVDGEDGRVVQSFDYAPYGSFLPSTDGASAPLLPWLFNGQERVQVAPDHHLYDFGARYYDDELWRFYAVDPEGQFFSPYLFAGDDPVDFGDPSGDVAFLVALLIAAAVGAAVGAAAGGVSYEVSRRQQGESFDGGKLALYMLAGGAAGAAGGVAGAFAGAAAGATLAAGGMLTYQTVATGVIVGAVGGAVDGAVAGATGQLLTNAIEGRAAGSGVGWAALAGAGGGALTGGVLGRWAGNVHAPVGRRLGSPRRTVMYALTDDEADRELFWLGPDATARRLAGSSGRGSDNAKAVLQALREEARDGEVVALSTHGGAHEIGDAAGARVGVLNSTMGRQAARIGTRFRGAGVDMRWVCGAGRELAPWTARGFGRPVLAAESRTFVTHLLGPVFVRWRGRTGIQPDLFSAFHLYYPSRLRTAWARLFGY